MPRPKTINNYFNMPNGKMGITVGKGQIAIIDAADYDLVKTYTWVASYYKSIRNYYIVASKKGQSKNVYMHRLLLGLTDSKIKGDHINRNPLDNTRNNLRPADARLSSFNRGLQRNNKLGIKHITPRGKYYRVTMTLPDGRIFDSNYNSLDKAVTKCKALRFEYFGETE